MGQHHEGNVNKPFPVEEVTQTKLAFDEGVLRSRIIHIIEMQAAVLLAVHFAVVVFVWQVFLLQHVVHQAIPPPTRTSMLDSLLTGSTEASQDAIRSWRISSKARKMGHVLQRVWLIFGQRNFLSSDPENLDPFTHSYTYSPKGFLYISHTRNS